MAAVFVKLIVCLFSAHAGGDDTIDLSQTHVAVLLVSLGLHRPSTTPSAEVGSAPRHSR
jgi:hypothetical protein